MEVIEQAQRYLKAIPPAISGDGGHNQTLYAARTLVWGFELSDAQAMQLLKEWNDTCQPPWSDRELEHKLREARTKPFDKPRGWLISSSEFRSRTVYKPDIKRDQEENKEKEQLPEGEYDLTDSEKIDLPTGYTNGFKMLLRSCFKEGDGVRVMGGFELPTVEPDPNGGLVKPQEWWLEKLICEVEDNAINKIYWRAKGKPLGVYLGVNPMLPDSRGKDSEVAAYRHCLLEFDKISLRKQWLLITMSKVPCAAVIYSGRRSIHAWVKVDAPDREEYDKRVNLLYNHFKAYKPDTQNKNPARLSRCPDAKRGDSVQLLMALDIGARSWDEWAKHLFAQGIGTTYSSNECLNYQADSDTSTIVGNNYLRKGGSCVLVGPSGIGKSSLGFQIAMHWALGQPAFGITPVKPLKILMIQAENDLADLHDMIQGIAAAMGVLTDNRKRQLLEQNLIINHNVSDTGLTFIRSMQRLADHHQPDLVIADPLLSFIGDDISKQEVVGKFCRNWLNPVLKASNLAFMAIHHTGKPMGSQQQNGRKKKGPVMKSLSDWAYHGIGSSELTNWARAIMVLHPVEAHQFQLIMAKRGKRAGATHPDGTRTSFIHIEHSPQGIYWIHTDPPEEVASATHDDPTPPKPLRPSQAAMNFSSANLHEFLVQIPEDGWTKAELIKEIHTWSNNKLGISMSWDKDGRKCYPADLAVQNMIACHKLATNGTKYVKGPDA